MKLEVIEKDCSKSLKPEEKQNNFEFRFDAKYHVYIREIGNCKQESDFIFHKLSSLSPKKLKLHKKPSDRFEQLIFEYSKMLNGKARFKPSGSKINLTSHSNLYAVSSSSRLSKAHFGNASENSSSSDLGFSGDTSETNSNSSSESDSQISLLNLSILDENSPRKERLKPQALNSYEKMEIKMQTFTQYAEQNKNNEYFIFLARKLKFINRFIQDKKDDPVFKKLIHDLLESFVRIVFMLFAN